MSHLEESKYHQEDTMANDNKTARFTAPNIAAVLRALPELDLPVGSQSTHPVTGGVDGLEFSARRGRPFLGCSPTPAHQLTVSA